MKNHIIELLKEEGYEPWRCSVISPNEPGHVAVQHKRILANKDNYDVIFTEGDETQGTFFFKGYPENHFSTMLVGGTCIFYIKRMDFEHPFIWGLHENNKPPTLIYPRPIIIKETVDVFEGSEFTINHDQRYDDVMNHCLANEDHETILDYIGDDQKQFIYKLTKD